MTPLNKQLDIKNLMNGGGWGFMGSPLHNKLIRKLNLRFLIQKKSKKKSPRARK